MKRRSRAGVDLPRRLPNLAVWLDAGRVGTAVGSNVATITDQSANGNDASQGTDANRAAAAYVEGHESLTFEPGDLYSIADAASLSSQDAKTFYIVGQALDSNVLSKSASDLTEEFYIKYDVVSFNVLFDCGGALGPRQTSNAFADSMASPTIVCVRQSTSGGTTTINIFENGTDVSGSTTGATETPTAAGADAMLLGSGRGTANCVGDLYELLYYTAAHSADERRLVHKYLGRKYGIKVAL